MIYGMKYNYFGTYIVCFRAYGFLKQILATQSRFILCHIILPYPSCVPFFSALLRSGVCTWFVLMQNYNVCRQYWFIFSWIKIIFFRSAIHG
ncbi:hypothetical protein B9Z55_024275 [Caenorhabditis nigoni]|uniref:Uncharacterized protein n=1 Tax=Caenorhabditis nigoni TaxID=1611254 RepID=A0A2G5SU11_9PELO|nr:hypothetical protein B9Z55_024275 [Caenorhabditis nigoni]